VPHADYLIIGSNFCQARGWRMVRLDNMAHSVSRMDWRRTRTIFCA
jgi:hypothetical protein